MLELLNRGLILNGMQNLTRQQTLEDKKKNCGKEGSAWIGCFSILGFDTTLLDVTVNQSEKLDQYSRVNTLRSIDAKVKWNDEFPYSVKELLRNR